MHVCTCICIDVFMYMCICSRSWESQKRLDGQVCTDGLGLLVGEGWIQFDVSWRVGLLWKMMMGKGMGVLEEEKEG
jgi:hypothetical protein